MTKRIGKLQLNRESVRRLTGAPQAGLGAAFGYNESRNPCQSISYCMACITYDATCTESTL